MRILQQTFAGAIVDWDKIWWGICKSILQIIDWIGNAFKFLIGARPVSVGEGGTQNTTTNILEGILTGETSKINPTYWYIGLACIGIMGVFIVIGAIKAQFTEDVPKSLGKIGGKAFASIMKILIMPVIFYVSLLAVGVIFNFLIDVMSVAQPSTSIAQSICTACDDTGRNVKFNDVFNKEIMGDGGGFQYLLCILSGCFLIVTLTTCCISLTKRFIEVFFYYLVAPIAIVRSPIDDGKSFDLWKENVISKLLGAGGIIIAMYLYYQIMPQFVSQVENSTMFATADMTAAQIETAKWTKNIIIIMFLIGGSAVPASASMMFAQLISQGAGQNEANNMMHTQQMMGNAFRMASAMGGKAVMGAIMGGGGAAGAAVGGTAAGALAGLSAGGAAAPLAAGAMAMGGRALCGSGGAASSGAGGSTTSPMGGGSGGGMTNAAASLATGGAGGGASPVSAMAGGAAGAAQAGVGGGGANTSPESQQAFSGVNNPIRQVGFRQSIANKASAAKNFGKGNEYAKASLGFGGAIGRTAKRITGVAFAPITGGLAWAGHKLLSKAGESRTGIKLKQWSGAKKIDRQLSGERRTANAEAKGMANKDKNWNKDIATGGLTANNRIDKEVGNLEKRVADFDKKFANMAKNNPEGFAMARGQQFAGEYATVKRRLDGLQGHATLGNKASEASQRLRSIADGSYSTGAKGGKK